MQALRGVVTFEDVDPADLVDVAGSLKGPDAEGIFIESPGEGVDQLLEWSLADLRLATNAGVPADQKRFAANAVLSARRALACLVDWYMARDCFSLCGDAPLPEKKQAELLLDRRLIDELTSKVIGRAIQKRNIVEHEYSALDIDLAEDTVERFRRTIQCLRVESDPSRGPCLFGRILHSSGVRSERPFAEFHGWLEPSFLLCSFDPRPWLGAILPETPDKAIVRRTFFDDVPTTVLLEVLQVLEKRFGRVSSYRSPNLWVVLSRECGLLPSPRT